MLTPEQIEAARQKFGITPAAPAGGDPVATRSIGMADAWAAADKKKEDGASGFTGLVRDVKADFAKRNTNVIEAKTKVAEGKQSTASGIFQAIGQTAGFVGDVGFDVLKSALKPEVRKKIGDFTTGVVKNILAIPDVQKQIEAYQSFKEKSPELASNLEAALNIASILPVGKAVRVGVKAGETALEGTTKIGPVLKEGAEEAIKAEKGAFIRDLIRPQQTKTVREAQVDRTTETGVGPFKKSVVAPTKQELKAEEYVSQIEGINPKNTKQQNYNVIKEANVAEAESLAATLKANDFAYPRKELLSRLRKAKEELSRNPVITGDAEKSAEKLIAEIERRINAAPAKGSELLKIRKEFDQWVENQKGPDIFDPTKEGALSVSTREIRRTINDFLDEKAPDVKVKESLRKQSALYDAMDNIRPKAAMEADTAVKRFLQDVDAALGTKNKAMQIFAASVGISGLGAAATYAPAIAGTALSGYLLYKGGKLVLSPQSRKAIGGVIEELGKSEVAKNTAKVAGGTAGGAAGITAAELISDLTDFLNEYSDDDEAPKEEHNESVPQIDE
jgi:hypothetical protein